MFAIKEKTQGPWRVVDLDVFPDDNSLRYEIIDGELSVAKSPHWHHQAACGNFYAEIKRWIRHGGHGEVTIEPGIIFSDADNVIPDVAWVSDERFARALDESGHLTEAPELVVEILSFSFSDIERDRKSKRKLYSIQGVQEYWIVDWRRRVIEVYRRDSAELRKVATLYHNDQLKTPLLAGFDVLVNDLFD